MHSQPKTCSLVSIFVTIFAGLIVVGSAAAQEETLLNQVTTNITKYEAAKKASATEKERLFFGRLKAQVSECQRIANKSQRLGVSRKLVEFFAANIDNPTHQAVAIDALGRLATSDSEIITLEAQKSLCAQFATQFEHYYQPSQAHPRYNSLNTMTAIITTLSISNSESKSTLLKILDQLESKWAPTSPTMRISEKIEIAIQTDRDGIKHPKKGTDNVYNTLRGFIESLSLPPVEKRGDWNALIAAIRNS